VSLTPNIFNKFAALLDRLEDGGFWYRLEHSRSDALMVVITVPGEIWEVELFEDGHIEFERFVSTGDIGGEDIFEHALQERENARREASG
jgi:hypothetical protein